MPALLLDCATQNSISMVNKVAQIILQHLCVYWHLDYEFSFVARLSRIDLLVLSTPT